MFKQWTYKVVQRTELIEMFGTIMTDEDLLGFLNVQGADGWMLVAYIDYAYIFRREAGWTLFT